LRPSGGEILRGSAGKDRVDLDRADPSGAADNFGEDGGVISGAGADMDDIVATAQFELVVHTGPQTGLPVVEPPLLVDRDEHVMVEVARIGVLRRPILAIAIGLRTRHGPHPKEALPRHRREGIDDSARAQLGREPQFLCVVPPGLLDRVTHLLLLAYGGSVRIAIFAARSRGIVYRRYRAELKLRRPPFGFPCHFPVGPILFPAGRQEFPCRSTGAGCASR
jgi:hypothetical protein